jgi:hypothetical protein
MFVWMCLHDFSSECSLPISLMGLIFNVHILKICVNFNWRFQLDTFGNLSQFLYILSDLKCYRSTFPSFTNHLGDAKPKEQPKKSSKENLFF